jgi:hypothetical protein
MLTVAYCVSHTALYADSRYVECCYAERRSAIDINTYTYKRENPKVVWAEFSTLSQSVLLHIIA